MSSFDETGIRYQEFHILLMNTKEEPAETTCSCKSDSAKVSHTCINGSNSNISVQYTRFTFYCSKVCKPQQNLDKLE